jgi:hypothetical protein
MVILESALPHYIYCDVASASYFLCFAEQGCCEGNCQGSEFLFVQDTPPTPTVNQSCGALHIITTFERHTTMQSTALDLAAKASGGAAIVSHADRIFKSSINHLLKSVKLTTSGGIF